MRASRPPLSSNMLAGKKQESPMGAEEWLAQTGMTRGASHRNARRDAGRGRPLPARPILSGAPASVRRAGAPPYRGGPGMP